MTEFIPEVIMSARMLPHRAFIAAVNFATITNRQSYNGQTTLSRVPVLTVRNPVAGAPGDAVSLALTRAFARSTARTVGDIRGDPTRTTLYVLLPLAVIVVIAFG
jgi:K+-transporting ATPase ATPase A chain